MTQTKKTSPWLYAGCGCGCLVLLIVAALAIGGVAAMRSAEGWVEDLEDPVKQADKARQLLGTEELPEGYRAHLTLSVPWLMDMAILSSSEALADPADPVEVEAAQNLDLENLDLGERAFIFFSIRASAKDRRELVQYLEGELRYADVLENIEFGVSSGELLRRGNFDLAGRTVRFSAFRGEFDQGDEDSDGVYSLSSIECDDSRAYLAIWFEKLETGLAEIDTTGTPADEGALRSFLGNFDLCAASSGN